MCSSDLFWTKHGYQILSIAFIVVIGMMAWLIFDKWVGLVNATNSGVETSGRVLEGEIGRASCRERV